MLGLRAATDAALAAACLAAASHLAQRAGRGPARSALAALGFGLCVLSVGTLTHPLLCLAALASPPALASGAAAALALALLLPASTTLGPSSTAILASATASAAGFATGARAWAEPIARPGLAAPGLVVLALGGLGAAVSAWRGHAGPPWGSTALGAAFAQPLVAGAEADGQVDEEVEAAVAGNSAAAPSVEPAIAAALAGGALGGLVLAPMKRVGLPGRGLPFIGGSAVGAGVVGVGAAVAAAAAVRAWQTETAEAAEAAEAGGDPSTPRGMSLSSLVDDLAAMPPAERARAVGAGAAAGLAAAAATLAVSRAGLASTIPAVWAGGAAAIVTGETARGGLMTWGSAVAGAACVVGSGLLAAAV